MRAHQLAERHVRNLSIGGVIGRFLASLILVLATFNPTGVSFVHWIAGNFPKLAPLQLVMGIALLGLWLFFLHATWRSLGTLGVALIMMACLLTLGLCWALIQARISGQAVVEEVKR